MLNNPNWGIPPTVVGQPIPSAWHPLTRQPPTRTMTTMRNSGPSTPAPWTCSRSQWAPLTALPRERHRRHYRPDDGILRRNTVTALWNYAQRYAMSDHFFGTTFGPSTVGAINLISGQTNGVINDANAAGNMVSDGNGGYSLIANADPVDDICSVTSGALVHMTSKNIGDLMNAAGVTWGFFAEGFDTTLANSDGSTGCRRSHTSAITRSDIAGLYPAP